MSAHCSFEGFAHAHKEIFRGEPYITEVSP